MASALPHPDDVAEAAAACQALLVSVQEHGWTRRVGGAMAGASGVPLASTNGAWTVSADVTAADLDAALDAVAATGLPHGLQVRPAALAVGTVIADRREMRPAPDLPTMALTAPPSAPAVGDDLSIAPADDMAELQAVIGDGFEATSAEVEPLVPAAVLGVAGLTAVVGRVDGAAVAGGIALRTDDAVGIFDVATRRNHQRRGYGAAITAHLVRAAFASGARWAWLHATDAGLPVYERLGFATVERSRTWISA